jgi:NADH-quinone oxidoreductase subunit J
VKTHEQGELPAFESTVTKIGTLLITDHVLAFEISSVLLLGALVGAAVISRPKKNIVKD